MTSQIHKAYLSYCHHSELNGLRLQACLIWGRYGHWDPLSGLIKWRNPQVSPVPIPGHHSNIKLGDFIPIFNNRGYLFKSLHLLPTLSHWFVSKYCH